MQCNPAPASDLRRPDSGRTRCGTRQLGEHAAALSAREQEPSLRAWTSEHPREEDERLPLTSGQSRLWFLNQLDPSSSEYNVVLQVALEGALDIDALSGALDDLVERHEILRTTYPAHSDSDATTEQPGTEQPGTEQPIQCIHETPHGLLGREAIDISIGFDLRRDLPIRAAVHSTGVDSWQLDLVIHHIATDGASLAPLVRDLAAAYTARIGETAQLQRPLAAQFADYARQQFAAAEHSEAEQADLDRWVEALQGIPAELELPIDGERAKSAAQPAAQLRFEIPADIAARIGATASRESASGFHGWLAGLAAFLHRIDAGDDIVIGSPSAGRTDPDVAELVGFFVNTLPLRVRFDGDAASFASTISDARDTALTAIDREHVAFERIVERTQPERRLGRHPLFQTMLSVEEPSGIQLELPGVTATPLNPATTGSAKVDLSFTLRPRGAGDQAVDGVLEYNAALFSTQAAEQLVENWLAFLRAAGDNAEAPLARILIQNDEAPALSAWESPATAASLRPILEVFTESAQRFARATAIRSNTETLDFAGLDERITLLASGLQNAGVERGDVVALFLPRSIDTVAALLAVWRAGAVVMPVDTELPRDRVQTMLQKSKATAIVHDGDEPAIEGLETPSIVVSTAQLLDEAKKRQREAVEASVLDLDAAAYLIFTSGTTGEPKGVQVPHRALAALLDSHASTLMPDANERRVTMAHTTGVGFDAAMDPIVWLAAGHELFIVSDEDRRNPEALLAVFADREIDAWETTPSYVAAIAEQTPLAQRFDEVDPATPFIMLLGGEAIDAELWTWLRDRRAVKAWNLYGPTEVGVDAMVASLDDAETPILGKTTTRSLGYVLDAALQPALPGAVGELWLAGAQLAHGYAGQAAATAERFVADPFANDGSRMYRTGDLVVAQAPETEGAARRIRSLGRSDNQVKIRGYRVEPGEIAAIIRSLDEVSGATVHAIDSQRGTSLGAWVIAASELNAESPEREREAFTNTVLTALRERVPGYMVPNAIAVIDEIPLTPNGKVDERALPALHAAATDGRAPANDAERAVAAAFEQTLGLASLSAEDSFFELGGHSFIAQPTIAAINATLGTTLPVQALFQAPTVEGLAALAASGEADVAASLQPILPLRPHGEGKPLFAVHPASGVSWKYSVLLNALETERPILGLQMPGIAPDEAEPETAETIDDLLDEYVEAMQAVQPEGPYSIIGWSFGGRLAQHIAVRLRALGHEVSLLGVLDAYPSEAPALAGVADGDAMWRAFLDANGIVGPTDRALDVHLVLDLLAEAGSPLADIPVSSIERMVRRFLRLGELFDATPVREFDGDLHVFEATEQVPSNRPAPQSWARYVSGEVTSSTVGVRHADMLTEEAIREIAPVLDQLLKGSHS
ncbi:non-ribosomal peptide synthetase [Humidisolicoccus flavus]|uniref:non-ribosomal peptide synthetase n=1 Tax=Humidisolicoccus flavus TaxID=3111414 RepID=UPI00324AAB33